MSNDEIKQYIQFYYNCLPQEAEEIYRNIDDLSNEKIYNKWDIFVRIFLGQVEMMYIDLETKKCYALFIIYYCNEVWGLNALDLDYNYLRPIIKASLYDSDTIENRRFPLNKQDLIKWLVNVKKEFA